MEGPGDTWSEHYLLLWYFSLGCSFFIVDLWRWFCNVTNSCCIWKPRAILSPADVFISACLGAFRRWLESPLTHTLKSIESKMCWTEKQSGSCLLYFFSFLVFPHHVWLFFPLCSVSCVFNDHFEAMFPSPVSFFKHMGHTQIFRLAAGVKRGRGKGPEVLRKVSHVWDGLPA